MSLMRFVRLTTGWKARFQGVWNISATDLVTMLCRFAEHDYGRVRGPAPALDGLSIDPGEPIRDKAQVHTFVKTVLHDYGRSAYSGDVRWLDGLEPELLHARARWAVEQVDRLFPEVGAQITDDPLLRALQGPADTAGNAALQDEGTPER